MGKATYDYYQFKNNTCLDDKVLYELVNSILKRIFRLLSDSSCRDFKGNVRIGVFETKNVNDEPAFEMEFTSRKYHSMDDVDFEKCEKEDVLFSKFDVSEKAFGLIQVALCYKVESGEIDMDMARDAYRQIDAAIKEICMNEGFFGYESNAG